MSRILDSNNTETYTIFSLDTKGDKNIVATGILVKYVDSVAQVYKLKHPERQYYMVYEYVSRPYLRLLT